MILSTSTNMAAFRPDGTKNTFETCIRMCANAGYKVLDINFCEAMNPTSELRGDNWESYVKHAGKVAKECGVVFTQSHLPYYDAFADNDEQKVKTLEELIRRSIIGSGMLGVKWAVTHPCTEYKYSDMNASKQRNLQYYTPHVELAKSVGVGIALENEFEYTKTHFKRMYCSSAYELRDLADAFSQDNVGICYDFGHANLTGATHRENLNVFGKRLKAVHVQDNLGFTDSHHLPFVGNINWQEAMAGLSDIDYEGELTYEIQEFTRFFPDDLKPVAIEMSIKVGNYLIALFERAQAEKVKNKL